MKLFFLVLACLVSLNAFAFNVCQFEDTEVFYEAVEKKQIRSLKSSRDHQRFSPAEKVLIHMAIRSDSYFRAVSQSEALRVFGDYYDNSNETGSNAGEIAYFAVGNYVFALVHYWPGDNEVGAFVELMNGRMRVLATVSDGWMECSRR